MGAAVQELAVVVAGAAQVVALVALIPLGAKRPVAPVSARLLLLTIAPGMPVPHCSHSDVARHSKGPHKMASRANTSTDCRSRWTAQDTQGR